MLSESRPQRLPQAESPPDTGRDETPLERADRNWGELTQELRVTQTGTQILTAFLLTLPFQPRFETLAGRQVILYLLLVSFGILTTVLMVAPVSMHRFQFHRGRKIALVRIANRITFAALGSFGLLIAGTVAFVFDVVLGGIAFWLAPLVAVLVLAVLWLLLPWRVGVLAEREETPQREETAEPAARTGREWFERGEGSSDPGASAGR